MAHDRRVSAEGCRELVTEFLSSIISDLGLH